jgi:actin-like ATPase involved in cell morphogenesis
LEVAGRTKCRKQKPNNLKKFTVLLSILFIALVPLKAHEYHVSIINIEYNSDSSSLEIAIKVFTEDIETALDKEFDTSSYFGSEKQIEIADSLVGAFLRNHLKLTIDSTDLNLHYLGNEVEEDATWSYLEVSGISDLKNIDIQCDLLVDVLHHQSNLINVSSGEKKKSVYLSKKRRQATIVL